MESRDPSRVLAVRRLVESLRTATVPAVVGCAVLFGAALPEPASGADAPPFESVPFDEERWELRAAESRVEEHLGRPSLYLKDGYATVRDLELTDGELAFDVAFTRDRGFTGGIFRAREGGDFEQFYLRPHQSGQPDASQYTPVFEGATGWQLYHGPSYSIPLTYRYDAWIPVRIVFVGGRADVYVDSDEPALAVDLKHAVEAGSVGLSAFNAEVHFSDVRVRAATVDRLRGEPVPEPEAPPHVVRRWEVSAAFPEARLQGVNTLAAADWTDLAWKPLAAETTGIVNLARLGGIRDDRNTVLARLELSADAPRVQKIRFGYSDRVRVFANGELLYSGTNLYRSRDYRYLGTIGLFDEVWVRLEAGANEVVFAVSEDFGGWGLLATVEPGG